MVILLEDDKMFFLKLTLLHTVILGTKIQMIFKQCKDDLTEFFLDFSKQ